MQNSHVLFHARQYVCFDVGTTSPNSISYAASALMRHANQLSSTIRVQKMFSDEQAWAQPMTLEGPGQNASYSAEYMEESVTQLTDAVGEERSLQALGLTLNGERVAQHALVSGLLALEVLVTGSLPAAILTQVCSASRSCRHWEVQCCNCPFLVPYPIRICCKQFCAC